MTPEEARAYVKECDAFKDYESMKAYIEDIVICLVYSSWHYSERVARKRVNDDMDYVKKSFEQKVPANDCAIEIGYSCG